MGQKTRHTHVYKTICLDVKDTSITQFCMIHRAQTSITSATILYIYIYIYIYNILYLLPISQETS